jgi:hypothetical protein
MAAEFGHVLPEVLRRRVRIKNYEAGAHTAVIGMRLRELSSASNRANPGGNFVFLRRITMRFRPRPATALAGLALFFALGGSSLAVSHAISRAGCGAGAVRGVAAVTGEPSKGIANLPDTFSSSRALFSRTYNCSGGAVQVRRVSTGVYQVHFAGNPSQAAVASASAGMTTVTPMPGGVFQVGLYYPGQQSALDAPFVLIAA